ncbi:type IV pilin protein [Candidatus Omnitrophota bacterium]
MFNNSKGFALHELLIAVIILGILVSLAIPRFVKTFEVARADQARAALRQIASGERVYRSGNGFFYPNPPGAANAAQIQTNLSVMLDEGINWNYSLVTTSADNFTATASRTAGGNAGQTITIDETDIIDESGWTP